MGFRIKASVLLVFLLFCVQLNFIAQTADSPTELKIRQLVEKKAEYHRLTGGQQNGYRINIHFGDREKGKAVRAKFNARFSEYSSDEDYQQPNFVVLVGDFKTKLEAFAAFKKIREEFPNAFIVNTKVRIN